MKPPTMLRLPNDADNVEHYAALREEASVHRVVLPEGPPVWLVTRYDDVRAGLRDERLSSDPRLLSSPKHKFGGRRIPEDMLSSTGRHMLNTDGAEHRRLRALVNAELSSGAVTRWRAGIERVVGEHLDRLAELSRQAGDEPVDLMSGFADPLPASVIGMVVGIDPDRWPDVARLVRHLLSDEHPASPEMVDSYHELIDLIVATVERKRTDPGDDLISALLSAPEPTGLRDLLSTVMALLIGGPPTTATAMSHGTVVLSSRPDLLKRALADDTEVATTVEELLRHHPPFPFANWRFATEDVELGGVTIPKDATVLLALAAANRDPRAYADPDAVCPHREHEPTHLAFGSGTHRCIGAWLARMELAVALPALFRRFPRLSLATPADELVWTAAVFDRRLESLPVWLHGSPR
ncbi:cytochrome P450 [Actinokineospora sp. PR83]|uniref:cytochrome P450 n=1 Tax=Actinokineospora sp. PR83 TaxID=2884908 RepID=UPI0027E1C144|nr:cytochrome P450 [Actinokineospora sp. PR83]MCG8920682.1 cytochrome P450 [Actinokineospora sp. PR83]